jgi:4-diphosphocytidyl-2-C-methyl-D-erythritol kinase
MKIADETVIIGRRAVSRSYAKINLTLDILGRMVNGYHEIETVMQTVGLFDLIVTDRTDSGISISTNLKFLPVNEKNIAYKAAAAFFKRSGIKGGAKILIHKNIPVAAGLAGGSGNAAAVLISLNLLFGRPFDDEELLLIGAELGADVPFCMVCGTQLCRGIGDIMTEVPSFPKRHVLLVKPPVNISTAEIYEKIDSEPIGSHPTTKDFIGALGGNSFAPHTMFNVMEQVSVKKYPVIRGISEKMILNGAEAAMMSGSGSAVFGIFDDYTLAKASADSFSHFYKEVYLTMTN